MEKAGISIGKEDLLVVFSTYDTNGNGELDYKEFSNIICGETTEY
jgi:Ca2+-binding EF-hand superfamily protein